MEAFAVAARDASSITDELIALWLDVVWLESAEHDAAGVRNVKLPVVVDDQSGLHTLARQARPFGISRTRQMLVKPDRGPDEQQNGGQPGEHELVETAHSPERRARRGTRSTAIER